MPNSYANTQYNISSQNPSSGISVTGASVNQTGSNLANSAGSVSSRHPIYSQLYDSRVTCQDVVKGQDTIKSKSTRYLPKLSGQDKASYENYLTRALFFSIGAKSLQALLGMASLKPPKIVCDDDLRRRFFNFKEDISFHELNLKMLEEVLKQNQAGVLIDWPSQGGDPYMTVYTALSIINWDYDDNGELSLVVICETFYEKTGRYQKTAKLRHRELGIDDNGDYYQEIFVDEQSQGRIYPQVRGSRLKKIPFIPFHSKGIGFTDDPPLMLDIANINISHYRSSADLEHGRHFTGLPTPMIFGSNSTTPIYIGSDQFVVIPDKQSNAKYLEFTGQGLQSLEKALDEKQKMMASLSARLIDNSSKGSEATDAVKLRYTSETASLTSVVKTCNVVLNMGYNIIAESLNKSPGSIEITLDTGFLDSKMSSTEMTALFDGYLSGAIDVGTLIYNLRKGQALDPDKNDSQVQSDIEAHKLSVTKDQSATQ